MSDYKMMSWIDLVKKYFPDASDELCDFILWEKTCFPFGPIEDVEEDIIKLKAMEAKDE